MTVRRCGHCRWWSWPGETCFNGASARYADYVPADCVGCCRFSAARGCGTCRHDLGGGHCRISLEMECRDGGFEAWEEREWDTTPQSAAPTAPLSGEPADH